MVKSAAGAVTEKIYRSSLTILEEKIIASIVETRGRFVRVQVRHAIVEFAVRNAWTNVQNNIAFPGNGKGGELENPVVLVRYGPVTDVDAISIVEELNPFTFNLRPSGIVDYFVQDNRLVEVGLGGKRLEGECAQKEHTGEQQSPRHR